MWMWGGLQFHGAEVPVCDLLMQREMALDAAPVKSLDHVPMYDTAFVRNGRAVAALWAVCTLLLGVLDIVILLQPSWILSADGNGHFGLYQVCEESNWGPECRGSPGALQALPSLQTAAGFMVGALMLVLFSLCCTGLLWFCHSGAVFKLSAWLQLSAASCQAITCLLFPDGWDSPMVRSLCDHRSDRYELGGCSVHWGFILAILGTFDALVLSVLGFSLGKRQDALHPNDVAHGRQGGPCELMMQRKHDMIINPSI